LIVLVAKDRGGADYPKTGNTRELPDDALCHSVGDVFRLRVPSLVRDRYIDARRPVTPITIVDRTVLPAVESYTYRRCRAFTAKTEEPVNSVGAEGYAGFVEYGPV
jgi:hypothetical protein